MLDLTENLIRTGFGGRVVAHGQLARLLDGTPQRRYSLVNRALKHGELLQLRRGLYVLAPYLNNKVPHPFVLAQALQPGSYVSFETALSFHGWIPEAVPIAMSVLPGRRRQEVNVAKLGLFRFYPLALRHGHFLEAVDRHELGGQSALIAQPQRALLDLICLRKIEVADLADFMKSMRIDGSFLHQVSKADWRSLCPVYSHQRMPSAIGTLERDTCA